jgi:hypothetical protein
LYTDWSTLAGGHATMLSREEHEEFAPGNIMHNQTKTHCINGDEFDEANTHIDAHWRPR